MLNIHPINIEHAEACLSILKESFDVPWQEVDSIFKSSNSLVLGAFSNNTLVGFCAASTVLDEAEILMCAVLPSLRRQGIGGLLVGRVLDECRRLNVLNFFLEVSVSNMPAQKLYEQHGFQVVGRRVAYYEKADGGFEDALVMRCGEQ